MNNWIRCVIALFVLISLGTQVRADETADGLTGCLDPKGNLFNVVPGSNPSEQCPDGAVSVQLGSLSNIEVGDSLISKVTGGSAFLDISQNLAVPPSCPPGQIALSDDQGGWVCTPPDFAAAANPASKVWVVPKLDRCENRVEQGRNRPDRIEFCGSTGSATEIAIINPGMGAASVSCYFFDRNGLFVLDLVQNFSVPTGAQRTCVSPTLSEDSSSTYAWAVIVSNQKILPTVRSFWRTYLNPRRGETLSAQIEAYPVDCDKPEGHEFVCQFAN